MHFNVIFGTSDATYAQSKTQVYTIYLPYSVRSSERPASQEIKALASPHCDLGSIRGVGTWDGM